MSSDAAFLLIGPTIPRSPVVLSVPHAGRNYSSDVAALARVPLERLRALEDRHADRLIEKAVAQGATAIVAQIARATIDLNRDPREIDPAMIDGPMDAGGLVASGKTRAGLGLFPRRLPSCGELWRGRMPVTMARARIRQIHQPYHQAIADRIEQTRALFGVAVLIDCHSMPPLPVRHPGGPARIVIGDRFGAGASAGVVDLVMAVIEGAGLKVARNHPYAGGYTVDRHGKPRNDVHAFQIEYDRSLYLDATLDRPTEHLHECALLLATIVAQIEDLLSPSLPIAAE